MATPLTPGDFLRQLQAGSRVTSSALTPPSGNYTYTPPQAPNQPFQFLPWLIDMISRPEYGVTTAIDDSVRHAVEQQDFAKKGDVSGAVGAAFVGKKGVDQFRRGDWAGGIGTALTEALPPLSGLAGLFNAGNDPEKKLHGADLIEKETDRVGPTLDSSYVDTKDNVNPWVKGIGGFASDMLLDPLTYIPGVGWLAKGAGAVGKGLKAAGEGALDGGGGALAKVGAGIEKGAQKTEKFAAKWTDLIPTASGRALVKEADKALEGRIASVAGHEAAIADWAAKNGKELPALPPVSASAKVKAKAGQDMYRFLKKNLKPLEAHIGAGALESVDSLSTHLVGDIVGKEVAAVAKSVPEPKKISFDSAISGVPAATKASEWDKQFKAWNAHMNALVAAKALDRETADSLRAVVSKNNPSTLLRGQQPDSSAINYVRNQLSAHDANQSIVPAQRGGATVSKLDRSLRKQAAPAGYVPGADIPPVVDTLLSASQLAARASTRETAARTVSEGATPSFTTDFLNSINNAVVDLGKTSDDVPFEATKAGKIAEMLPALERAAAAETPKSRSSIVVAASRVGKATAEDIEYARMEANDLIRRIEERFSEGVEAKDPEMVLRKAQYEQKAAEDRVRDVLVTIADDGLVEGEAKAALFAAAGIHTVTKTDEMAVVRLQDDVFKVEEGADAFYRPVEVDPRYVYDTMKPEVEQAVLAAETEVRDKIVKRLFDQGIKDADEVALIVEKKLPQQFNRSQAIVDAIASTARVSDMLVDTLGAGIIRALRSTKTSVAEGREIVESLKRVVFAASGEKPQWVDNSIRNMYFGKNADKPMLGMTDAKDIARDQVNKKYDELIAAQPQRRKALEKARATELKGAAKKSFEVSGVNSTTEIGALNEGADNLKTEFTDWMDSFIKPERGLTPKQGNALVQNAQNRAKEAYILRDVYDTEKLLTADGKPTILARVLDSLGVEPVARLVADKQVSSFVSRVGQKVPEEVRKGWTAARAQKVLGQAVADGIIPKGGQQALRGFEVGTVQANLQAANFDAAQQAVRVLEDYADVFLFPKNYKPVTIGVGDLKHPKGYRAEYHGNRGQNHISIHKYDRTPEELVFYTAHEMGHHLDHMLGVTESLAKGDKLALDIATKLRAASPEAYAGLGDNEVVADAIHYFVAMTAENETLHNSLKTARLLGDKASVRSGALRQSDEDLAEVYRATHRYLSSKGVLKRPDNAMGRPVSTHPELEYDALENAMKSFSRTMETTDDLLLDDATFFQLSLLHGNAKAVTEGNVETAAGILGKGYHDVVRKEGLGLRGEEAAGEIARRTVAGLDYAEAMMHEAGRPLLFMTPDGTRVPMSFGLLLRQLGSDPNDADVVLRSMFNRGGSSLVPNKQGYGLTQVAWSKVADAVAHLIQNPGASKEEILGILRENTHTIKGKVVPITNGASTDNFGYYLVGNELKTYNAAGLAEELAGVLHRNGDAFREYSAQMSKKYVELGTSESMDIQRAKVNELIESMYQVEKDATGKVILGEHGAVQTVKDEFGDAVLAPGGLSKAAEVLAAMRSSARKLGEDGAAMEESIIDAERQLNRAFDKDVLDAAEHRQATVNAQATEKTIKGGQKAARKAAQARSDSEAKALIDDPEVFSFKSIEQDRRDVATDVTARMTGLLHGVRVKFAHKYLMENVYDLGQSHTAMTGLWNAPRDELLRDIRKMGGVVKGTKSTELDLAFSALQNGKTATGSAIADAIIPKLQQYMEPLLHMAYESDKAVGNVLFKNNMDIELLNREIRLQFNGSDKFMFSLTDADTAAKDALKSLKKRGGTVKNEDEWLHRFRIRHLSNQWRKWPVDDPLQFLRRFDNAITRIYGQMALGHSLRARAFRVGFASETPKSGYARIGDFDNNPVFSVLDANTYYNKEYLYEVRRLNEFLTMPRSPEGGFGDFLRNYIDPLQNAWKESVTIRRPGHHVRNEVGDMTLTIGIEGTRYLGKSMKDAFALMSLRNDYEGVDIIQAWNHLDGVDFSRPSRLQSVEQAAIDRGEHVIPKATKVMTTGKFGSWTAGELHEAIRSFGLLRVARDIEDIGQEGKGSLQRGIDFLMARNTKFDKAFKGVSEAREHHVRMSHFLQIVYKAQKDGYVHLGFRGKYYPKDANDLFRVASEQVKKYHPDSSMMTNFELRYMRRIIPFYSWFRSAIPAVIESSLVHPGRAIAYPKASYNLSIAMGLDPDSMSDPFPKDQVFPSFLKEQILGPQFKIGGNYVVLNPGISQVDIGNMLFNPEPIREVAGMTTPIFRVPAELLSGGSWSTGGRINDASEYLDNSLPFLGPIGNITGYSPTGSVNTLLNDQGLDEQLGQSRHSKTALDQWLSATNFLLGINLQNQSRPNYISYANFEKRDAVKKPGDRSGF